MVDTRDLKSRSPRGCEGSTPSSGTKHGKPWNHGLTEMVLNRVSRYVPVYSSSIHMDIVEDYGNVSHRTIVRHLTRLKQRGEVELVYRDMCPKGGYVRARKKP